jgi:hypothetical protein
MYLNRTSEPLEAVVGRVAPLRAVPVPGAHVIPLTLEMQNNTSSSTAPLTVMGAAGSVIVQPATVAAAAIT